MVLFLGVLGIVGKYGISVQEVIALVDVRTGIDDLLPSFLAYGIWQTHWDIEHVVAKMAWGSHAIKVFQGSHSAYLAYQMQPVAEQVAEFYAITESKWVIPHLLAVGQKIAGGAGWVAYHTHTYKRNDIDLRQPFVVALEIVHEVVQKVGMNKLIVHVEKVGIL